MTDSYLSHMHYRPWTLNTHTGKKNDAGRNVGGQRNSDDNITAALPVTTWLKLVRYTISMKIWCTVIATLL